MDFKELFPIAGRSNLYIFESTVLIIGQKLFGNILVAQLKMTVHCHV